MGKQKDFVAINILCMNQNKATACSVALVKVRNNEIVDEFHSLVSPPSEIRSSGFNMVQFLHGITEEQTEGKPTFIELLPEMEAFIEGLPLVVHNGITEYWAFIRALEYYRSIGCDVSSGLEGQRMIDTKLSHHINLTDKNYQTLHDARLYAEFYISQDLDDELYPRIKELKRPDVTQEHMAYVKTKEKVPPMVYEDFDYSTSKRQDNPYFGYGVFITGETECFISKTDLYLTLRDEFGIHPKKGPAAGTNNLLIVCNRGAGQGRIKTATEKSHVIIGEEDLLAELDLMGIEVLSHF